MENLSFENNQLNGNLLLPLSKEKIAVNYNLESDNVTKDDYLPLVSKSKTLINELNVNIKSIEKEIAKELTDSAYEQSDFTPQHDEYEKLENELEIYQLNFYNEYFVIVFKAESNYPEMKIYCQLNDNMEIIDLSVV